jgi:putative transposase
MKATKMRAYPTKGQQNRANQMLKIHCDMYNACIQERIQAYRINKTNVNYKMQSAQLKHVRENDPVCAQYSFSSEQRTIKRVDKAFKAFFQRLKQGQTPGFPRYKPYKRFNTVDHTAGNGSKWVPTQGKWAKAYFQGIGHIKVSEHTHIEGKIKQISLTREGRKWWVIVVHENQPNMLPSTGRSIGFDLGIARFLTTSDGEIIENPRFNQKVSDELADLQYG